MEGIFPLWDISPLARTRIIRRMRLADILELSARSEPFHDFLKANKLPEITLTFAFIREDTQLWAAQPDHTRAEFRFQVHRNSFSFQGNSFSFGDKTVSRKDRNFVVLGCLNFKMELDAMEELVNYIASIAHVKYRLHCHRYTEYDLLETFAFKVIKQFPFSGVIFGFDMAAERYTFTEEQIRFLQEHAKIENLSLVCLVRSTEPLERVNFTQKRLCIERCRWLQPKVLLNDCRVEDIEIHFTQGNIQNLVEIAVQWQRGGTFINLKKMKLYCFGDWNEGNKLEILIDGFLGVAVSHAKKFEPFKGEIKRFTDGKVAKVEAEHIEQNVIPRGYLSLIID